jgi:YVTN family beta-propeller protein
MKRNLCVLGYLWVLLVLPLDAHTVRIYVANKAGTTIEVIDPATNKIVRSIGDLEAPEVARFSPDGRRVYITYGGEDVLIVMDGKTGKYIKKVPISGAPNDVAVTKDGKLILVCIRSTPGGLDVIDATSLEKIKTIPVEAGGLHDIVVTPDGKYAAAGSPEGKLLVLFDLQKKEIAWDMKVENSVNTLVVETNPDGSNGRLFVNIRGLHGFAVVDLVARKEVARIEAPEDDGFAEPKGPKSHGIEISPDGKTLWLDSIPANGVFVYSLPELKLLGRVSLPTLQLPGQPAKSAHPGWITFTPDSKTAYVTNESLDAVAVIDVKTMKEVARIPVGERPGRISTMVMP